MPVANEQVGNRPAHRAAEGVSSSSIAIEQLLRTLAHRVRATPIDPIDRRDAARVVPLLTDLLDAYRNATGLPEQSTAVPPQAAAPQPPARVAAPQPPLRATPQHAVAAVLASPRATRDLFDALTDKARAGQLPPGQHVGTAHAAQRLLHALAKSGASR